MTDPTNPSSISLPPELLSNADEGELFALKVKGDSMLDALVSDGDIVVMKKVDRARNGEMTAVWIPERGEMVLRHFYLEQGIVRLQPANPTMKPTFHQLDDIEVKGKVMLVMRQMS